MARTPEEIIADLEKAGIPRETIQSELKKRGVDISSSKGSNGILKKSFEQTPIGMMAKNVQSFSNLSPEAQKGLAVGAGAAIGEVGGPMASGLTAATMGGLTEAAQNPSQTAKLVMPAIQTAIFPTQENANQLVQNFNAVKEQVPDFLKRRAIEGGTAAIASGVVKGAKALVGTPSGPFSAAFDSPSMASKSAREGILKELGSSKTAAMAGEDLAEASRLRRLIQLPAGRIKLSEEAIQAVESGKPMSNTQLLAYDEALGKVQSKGGTFANDYAKARTAIRSMLKEQAPNVAKFKSLARKVFLSEGGEEAPVNSLIEAVRNPISSVTKYSGPARILGAGSRMALESLPPISASMAAALDSLSKNRRK